MRKEFKKVGVINYKEDRFSTLWIIGSFMIFVILGIVFIVLTKSQEYNTVGNPLFLLSCLCYIVIHELIHLIFMKVYGNEKIHVTFKFPTISVGSEAKYSKKHFAVIILAPVLILGGLLILALLFLPKEYTFFLTILTILNFGGAGGDYNQFFKIMKYPADTFFQDNSVETVIYQIL